MQCRFFLFRDVQFCSAGSRIYVPSPFEAKEYCTVERHRMCPFYCMHRSDGAFDLKTLELRSAADVR